MSAKPPAEGAEAAKPKSKKMLFIIIGVVVLALGGGGAFFFLKKGDHADSEEGDGKAATKETAKHSKPATPPVFMPIESLVVNLGDQGASRFAQVGITLQIMDAPTGEAIKALMPVLRNGILKAVSKRTSADLLSPDGKDKLAEEILELIREVTDMPTNKKGYSPVEAVLFSSFIVQ
jgi:flagellar FliL protein